MTTTQRDLPFGAGALRLRGRVWWMFYMDNAGGRHQVTTGKTDYNEARRLLAQLVLPIWRERIAAIEVIAGETGKSRTAEGAPTKGDRQLRTAGGGHKRSDSSRVRRAGPRQRAKKTGGRQ